MYTSRKKFGRPFYRIRDLGTLGGDYSETTAINDHNLVVGHSWISNPSLQAFRWQ